MVKGFDTNPDCAEHTDGHRHRNPNQLTKLTRKTDEYEKSEKASDLVMSE